MVMVLNPQPVFFIYFPLFTNERYTLLSTLTSIDCNLLSNTDFVFTQTSQQTFFKTS